MSRGKVLTGIQDTCVHEAFENHEIDRRETSIGGRMRLTPKRLQRLSKKLYKLFHLFVLFL